MARKSAKTVNTLLLCYIRDMISAAFSQFKMLRALRYCIFYVKPFFFRIFLLYSKEIDHSQLFSGTRLLSSFSNSILRSCVIDHACLFRMSYFKTLIHHFGRFIGCYLICVVRNKQKNVKSNFQLTL